MKRAGAAPPRRTGLQLAPPRRTGLQLAPRRTGLQLAACRRNDALVVRAAAALENRLPWAASYQDLDLDDTTA